jgi:hypothetical protein
MYVRIYTLFGQDLVLDLRQGAPKKKGEKRGESVGCFYVGLRFVDYFVKCRCASF